ncbi:tripartite tricarboxylate transporter substrate binding protein [Marinomonas shanghaiensis]|uniref:tripartite tricarboxylate transporter substrate binding protein n=1 Tax=Marinomonas shanghaiensis TaxID=2202418 RepID=UPI003A8EE59C
MKIIKPRVGMFLKTLSMTMLCGASISAMADYPERSIKMIVAYGAGGGTDIAARTLAPYIEKYMGENVSIVIENKPGAGGEIGFTELAKASPDGYTIGFVNTPNLITIPIQRKARYSLADFTPIGNVVDDPGAFSVSINSQIKSLGDLVSYANEHPGKLTYGTTGIGGDDHLAALAFEKQTNIKMKHIPFKGSADVRTAALGEHIDLANMNMSEAIADGQEGNLLILGQMGESRWSEAPNVPTFMEQGYDVVSGSMRGLAAPAGLPSDIQKRLEKALEQAVSDPEFAAKAKDQNLPLSYMNSKDFGATLQRLHDIYNAIWTAEPWIKG